MWHDVLMTALVFLVQSSEEMDRGLDDYWKEDGAALGEGGGPGGLNPALDDFFGGSKGGA